MEIVFLEQAEKDREYWKKSGNIGKSRGIRLL